METRTHSGIELRSACTCAAPDFESRFGLVDPKCEALLECDRDGAIVRSYPHDASFFVGDGCSATRIEDLVRDEWLPIVRDRLAIATSQRLPSTVEVSSHGSTREGCIRIRVSPGANGAYVLFRDTSFDPRAVFVQERDDASTFWKLFDTAPVPLGLTTKNTTTSISPLRVNRRFTELFGYSSSDLPTAQHWWAIAYPEPSYRDAIRGEWFRRVREAAGDFSRVEPIDAVVRCKDGSEREIEFSATTIGDFHVVSLVDVHERNRAQRELAARVAELERALAQVKVLTGLLPLCAWCKHVRDDDGYWTEVEQFLVRTTDIQVTHGICPDCRAKHFGTPARTG